MPASLSPLGAASGPTPEVAVVGEAGSVDTARVEVARTAPDVVVVDLKLTAVTD